MTLAFDEDVWFVNEDTAWDEPWVRPKDKQLNNIFCPTGEGGGVDPTCKKESANPKLDELQALSDSFKKISYQEIQPRVEAIMSKMPKSAAVQLAKDFGVSGVYSRAQAIKGVVQNITARKGSWDRANFRGTNNGGPGSGNFSHAGRPGEVGGSSSSISKRLPDSRIIKLAKESAARTDDLLTAVHDHINRGDFGKAGNLTEFVEEFKKNANKIDGNDIEYHEIAGLAKLASRYGVDTTDLLALVGSPTNANVKIGFAGDSVAIQIEHDDYQVDREINFKNKTIENLNAVNLSDKKGLIARMLKKQVDAATAVGFHSINAFAVRSAYEIGYKYWPLLGYVGTLPKYAREKTGKTTIQELYETKKGREWWAENGTDISLSFDLTPGSLSHYILDNYMKEKGYA